MKYVLNKTTKIILVLILVFSLFVGVTCASSVSNSNVSFTNIYGTSGWVDISNNPSSSTSLNITHNTNEYLTISNLTASVYRTIAKETIILTPVDLRGSAVYLSNSQVINGYDFDYGSGGYMVGTNPWAVAYNTFGNKNISVTLTGWDGTNTIRKVVNTSVQISYVNSMGIMANEMGYQDLVGLYATISGSSVTAHWYASKDNGSTWSDTYMNNPTSLNTTFGKTAGIPSGNYTFKLVLSSSLGTMDTYTDIGIKDVYIQVYRKPTIDSMSVTRCVDVATPVNYSVSPVIDTGASITSYKWQYASTSAPNVWYDVVNGNSSSGSAYLSIPVSASAVQNTVGNYNLRVILNTSEGYSMTSPSVNVSVIDLQMNINSETRIQQAVELEIQTSANNLVPSTTYNYKLQVSTDQLNWTYIGNEGTLTSENPSYNTSIIITQTGLYYLRVHAWDDDSHDYYTYSYPSLSVEAPAKFTLTSNVSDGETTATVLLTLTTNNDSDSSLVWRWQESVDDGETWSYLDSSSGKVYSKTVTTTDTTLTLFRVIGSNDVYSVIKSNVVGYVYHPDIYPITSASGITTSSSDTYSVPTKTLLPYEIVDSYSLSSAIGMVVTKHALYMIDATNKNATTSSVLSTLYLPYGAVNSSKYYNGHLMYETEDGRIVVQNIMGSSGFGNSFELIGFNGTVKDYDMSNYNYMVAIQGNGIYTFDNNGDLQQFIKDTSSDSFAMTKVTTDNGLEYAVLASSSSSDVLIAYTGESQNVSLQLPNNINGVYTVTYDAERVIVVTNTNTLVCQYSLTVDSAGSTVFVWGNYVTFPTILSDLSSTRNGLTYIGTNLRTLYGYDSTANNVANYPTSDVLTDADIAKTTSDFLITGGNNGQVSILQNGGTGWEGMQSIPLPTALRTLTMSDTANTFLACTASYVYCAVKTQSEESETVLTTTYYLKISVVDSYGNPMSNSGVRVISDSGTSLYTTDTQGSVTIEVIPTKTYTISLPNGEDTVVYKADNYALQYITLRYPSTAVKDRLNYGATVRDNRYLDVWFNNSLGNPYSLRILITDSNHTTIVERNVASTANYSYAFDTSGVTTKNYIVTISADPVENYENHVYNTYTLSIRTASSGTNQSDRWVLGNIPIIPDEMDDNWKTLIFGALIMIIGALFSYNHSVKGCVVITIIAAVMTYFGLLPLNPIWIGCMVVLAFLAVYSWAAQNEG